jgi:uncharacterized membrane protein YdbT with pleckstrin-like domain
MSYIDSNLMPDETISFRTRKSTVIFSFPLLLLLCGLIFWAIFMFVVSAVPPLQNLANQFYLNYVLLIVVILISLGSGFNIWLEYITSDFVVTNRRLIMKEGFFVRHMAETRLTAVSHVSVQQNLMGQLFNYGTVFINNFGGSSDQFTQISSPVAFQKNVHIQLDAIKN